MKTFLKITCLLLGLPLFAQVGINTTSPDPSSALDIQSTDKGMLIPRVSLDNVTTTQIDGVNTAATGLMIYNTNASTTGGSGVGFYVFNGGSWDKVITSADGSLDADFFEEGTTAPPDDINDSAYRTGDLILGANSTVTNAKLVIQQTQSNAVGLGINQTNLFDDPTVGDVGGFIINANATMDFSVNRTFDGLRIISNVNDTGSSSTFNRGTSNVLLGTSDNNWAVSNSIGGTTASLLMGLRNEFGNTSSNFQAFGVYNYFRTSNDGGRTGTFNAFGIPGSFGFVNDERKGVENYFQRDNTSAKHFGMKNTFLANAGDSYGVYNEWTNTSNSSTGNKYGIYTLIPATTGGVHYGTYSNVLKSGSYAGYFLGSVSIGTTTSNNYILPASRGTNGQVMQTDGSGNISWVDTSGITGDDADFYEVGGTTPPDAITDNIYTQGALAIGDTSTDESRLNVTANASENYNNGLKIDLASETSSGSLLRGVDIEINSDVSSSPTNVTGIEIENNANAAVKAGISSTVSDVGGGSGKWNLFLSTSNQASSTGNITGIWNTVSVGGGSGLQFGVRQRITDINGNSSGTLYGYNSDVFNNGSGPSIGFSSLMQTNNNSIAVAFDANFSGNSGSGNKYGLRTTIPTTVGGTNHYGVYAEALRSGSNTFAGYFLGNVSIGTSSSNNYIFPASRGSNGQIMQTDGSGAVTWVDASTLGGGDADFYEEGTTNAPDAITDDMYTQGNVAIGKTTADYPLDIDASGFRGINITMGGADSNLKYALRNEMTNTGNSLQRGVYNNFTGTGTGSKRGLENRYVGNFDGGFTGLYNQIIISSTSGSTKSGMRNVISAANGTIYGVENNLTVSGTGNIRGTDTAIGGLGTGIFYGSRISVGGNGSTKYGSYIDIDETTTGTHYGLFSQVLNSSGFAGYFLGNVSIGTTTSNNYILPSSRGTNGQIMQTDGSGNVSWVNNTSTSFWSRTGSTLDVANAADDISFSSDQTSIIFPATSGTPSTMMHLFATGTNNSDRMVFSQSPAFSNWGLMYRDFNDSFRFLQGGADRVVINLGSGNPLVVNGTAQATSFQSATTTYPDYVFESYLGGVSKINPDYEFKNLETIEEFIIENGHLPGIKSFGEVKANDMQINLTETSVKNLEKIEELFIYAIQLKKENEVLKNKQKTLENRINKIEQLLQEK